MQEGRGVPSRVCVFVPEDMDIGIRPERLLRDLGETEFIRRHQCPVRSLAAFEKSEYADDWRELMRLYLVLHAGDNGVKSLQQLLASKEQELVGRNVVLHKVKLDGPALRFVYDVHLDDVSGPILGRTREQLTHDLLKVKRPKQSLPTNIYRLRISAVTTLACQQPHSNMPEPWSKSRLWLGVSLHGIASFTLYWKK